MRLEWWYHDIRCLECWMVSSLNLNYAWHIQVSFWKLVVITQPKTEINVRLSDSEYLLYLWQNSGQELSWCLLIAGVRWGGWLYPPLSPLLTPPHPPSSLCQLPASLIFSMASVSELSISKWYQHYNPSIITSFLLKCVAGYFSVFTNFTHCQWIIYECNVQWS